MGLRTIASSALLVIACTRSAPSADPPPGDSRAVPIASAPARAPPLPASPPPRAQKLGSGPKSRVHGQIDGRFVPASSSVIVGEPVVITLEVRPTVGPMHAVVGGDGRNSAAFPTRVAVKAIDLSSGDTVCDNVKTPPFPSFGGIGSEQTFAKGQWLRDPFVLNPACPGLAHPGRYRITLHRRLTDLQMKVTKPGATHATSCDVHPLHEGPASFPGEPACERLLDARPSVTTEFELSVEPFDAHSLRRAVQARLRDTSDEMGRQRLTRWLCGWLACGCSTKGGATDADVLSALPASLPGAFPAPCP